MTDENNLDKPVTINPDDPRYGQAAELLIVATIGIDLSRTLFMEGFPHEALSILNDCRELGVKATDIVTEIGDIEKAMQAGRSIQFLDERIEEVKERIAELEEGN